MSYTQDELDFIVDPYNDPKDIALRLGKTVASIRQLRWRSGVLTIRYCVSCCTTCNMMKGTLSSKEFLEHVEKITNKSI